ncbi:MAG: aspartyl protease family protein [Proteobacteria bacterium]|nr:aspartyl protease family protein [Pseudomonadota bacterium]
MNTLFLGALAVWGLWAATAEPARADCVAAPQLGLYQAPPAPNPAQVTASQGGASDSAAGDASRDRLGRVVAPVNINNQGPFRFIVDTGANRSVVSRDLAGHLGLVPSGSGEVHSVHGVTTAPLVPVQLLQYRNLSLESAPMPILESAVLAGEQGLLGVDGMAGRRLKMDFEHRCIEIIPSRGAPRLAGWEVIRGDLRFGSLMVIRGSINGLHVNLLLDTGSDTSLANEALRDALNARVRRNRARMDFAVAFNSGQPVVLENAIALPSIGLGGGVLEVRDVTAYIGNFHIFHLWNLIDEPALLLGMDVLSQTRGVAIDYQRHTVAFRIRGAPGAGSHLDDARSTFMSSVGVRN